MCITPEQSCAARALLGWSQTELSKRAKVARTTLAEFEAGSRNPYQQTLEDIRHTIVSAGVVFIPENGGGAGVRMKKPRNKR